jgi:pimeloyl-ACP methyl ester carboxylesterase
MNTSASNTAAGQSAWRSPLLGTANTVTLPQGPLDYWSRGSGPTLVLVHGWLVNANHWRHVVDALATRYRCITLEMPLGSHRVALHADADLSPVGCGQLIADALAALSLRDVTLIGNDSGGAYAQIAVSLDDSGIAQLILISCETPFDALPPPAFKGLAQAAQTDEGLHTLLRALQNPSIRDSAAGYGQLSKHGIEELALLSYVMPSVHNADVLHDAAKVMRSADAAPVIAAGLGALAACRVQCQALTNSC